jgi:HEAT repeat protein
VSILTDGVYLEDELADHAKASLSCLVKRFNNAPNAFRGKVVTMMVQALTKGRNEVDSATIQSTDEAILGALRDTDEHFRANTVRALGKFGGAEMIPALEQVAKTDKAVDKLDHSLLIREYAVKAVAEIQKRAGQKH